MGFDFEEAEEELIFPLGRLVVKEVERKMRLFGEEKIKTKDKLGMDDKNTLF